MPTRTSGVPPTRSLDEIQKTSEENLLPTILELAHEDFLAELDSILRVKHFLAAIGTVRASERRAAAESAWLSPQIRELALQLPTRLKLAGDSVRRAELRYKHLRRWVKVLNQADRDRHKNNLKILAARNLMKAWPRSAKARRMTLAEVDAMKAQRAGLI